MTRPRLPVHCAHGLALLAVGCPSWLFVLPGLCCASCLLSWAAGFRWARRGTLASCGLAGSSGSWWPLFAVGGSPRAGDSAHDGPPGRGGKGHLAGLARLALRCSFRLPVGRQACTGKQNRLSYTIYFQELNQDSRAPASRLRHSARVRDGSPLIPLTFRSRYARSLKR